MQSSKLSAWLGEAIGEAGSLRAPRLPGNDIVIIYTPGAEPPAHQLYLAYLHAGRRAVLASAVEASLHILPYREDVAAVIIFTPGGKDSLALIAAEQASTIGLETILVGPELHPAYEEKAELVGAERITVKGRHPIMAATIASLKWSPSPLGARAARLDEEVADLASAADWVMEKFKATVEALSEESPEAIYYSPAMAPAAFYLAKLASKKIGGRPYTASLQYLSEAKRGVPTVVMLTELERFAARERLMTARVRGVKYVEVAINTDPITAGLYGMLLSAAAYQEMP